MKFDLKTMTRKQLEKLRVDVETALERVTEKERKAAIQAAEKAARAHGFTLAEIAAGAPKTAPKRKATKVRKPASVAKYVNPKNKDQTWSGRGRQPDWFKAALASGKDPDQLMI